MGGSWACSREGREAGAPGTVKGSERSECGWCEEQLGTGQKPDRAGTRRLCLQVWVHLRAVGVTGMFEEGSGML